MVNRQPIAPAHVNEEEKHGIEEQRGQIENFAIIEEVKEPRRQEEPMIENQEEAEQPVEQLAAPIEA